MAIKTTIRFRFDFDLTAVRPRYAHSTTYFTAVEWKSNYSPIEVESYL